MCVHACICVCVVVLQTEPMSSFLLAKHSTTELHPTPKTILFHTSTWGTPADHSWRHTRFPPGVNDGWLAGR